MVNLEILKLVTYPTPAVSFLVVLKKYNKLYLCLYPTYIDKVIKRFYFPPKIVEEIAAQIGSAKYFTIFDAKETIWQLPVSRRT